MHYTTSTMSTEFCSVLVFTIKFQMFGSMVLCDVKHFGYLMPNSLYIN